MKLARDTLYNFVGLASPLLVALYTIPRLVHGLGDARFGLLTLIWAVVSYFGLFDLGLGRALTQQLALLLERDARAEVGPMVTTASALMAILGCLASVLMVACASWAVHEIKQVDDPAEAIAAIRWMAMAMPFIVMTSGFRGILEAQHAFGVVNLIRIPMGIFTFVGPLLVLWCAGPRLDIIAAVLSLGRVVACLVHAVYAIQSLPLECRAWRLEGALLRPLCVSGGWMTVSNIVSPFMGYVDRFVVGATLSAAAVAFYATPHELVTKLWIIPGALTAVLFPTFAARARTDPVATRKLFGDAVRWLFLILLPITVTIALFAHEILAVWIGAEFANRSALLLQIFAVGMLVNCLAHVPFTLIQGVGAAHLTAWVHAFELPFFLLALWLLTPRFGLAGAATAWFLRMTVDTVLMYVMCYRAMGWRGVRLGAGPVAIGLLTLAGFSGLAFASLMVRMVWVAALTGFVVLACVRALRLPNSIRVARP